MLIFKLWLAVFGLATGSKTYDVATSTAEAAWFDASMHMGELGHYCRTWCGPRNLLCFDLFSNSQKVATTWLRNGFAAQSFDIATDPDQDILSERGFMRALTLSLSLRDGGFLCAAPPCSLWVPISQSVHGRYASGSFRFVLF